MTADRKAALMEYAMAVQTELDAFTEAMFGPPGDLRTEDAWSAADLLLKRLEIATRVYTASGAMLTITRWQRGKLDQVEAQRAALKAEVPPSGASPIESGVIHEEERKETRPHAKLQADWTKLVEDARQKKLPLEAFKAVSQLLRKKRIGRNDDYLHERLLQTKAETAMNDLIAEAESNGWLSA